MYSRVVIIICFLVLNSCGFSAVYSQNSPAYQQLRHIKLAAPEKIEDIFFYNRLQQLLPLVSEAKYILQAEIDYEQNFNLIQKNSDVFREFLLIKVRYRLTDRESSKLVHQNEFIRFSSYNITEAPYNNELKKQDTKEALATMAAEEVRSRLSLYFKQQSTDANITK